MGCSGRVDGMSGGKGGSMSVHCRREISGRDTDDVLFIGTSSLQRSPLSSLHPHYDTDVECVDSLVEMVL